MESARQLPTYLAGARTRKLAGEEVLRFATGEGVRVGRVGAEFLDAWDAVQTYALAETPLHEITAFLYTTGQNWKRRDHPRRAIYERDLVRYLGYSPKAARTEADWIAFLLSSSFRLYDLLAVELGSWQIVDAWTPREEALVKALPRGTTLHMAPGNVPLSVVVSILRALITKNASIVKMSASDPFTATALIQSFVEIDPTHPVSTSISAVYWPTDRADTDGAAFARRADTIVAWGGDGVVAWAKRHAGPNTEVVPFGPKRSFSVVGAAADPVRAATAVAVDCSVYDQRGCFSTRQVFVHRDRMAAFVTALAGQLAKLDDVLPAGTATEDEVAIRALTASHAHFLGILLAASPTGSWTIIRDVEGYAEQHPLGRTVFVTPFDDAETIYSAVTPEVQTVAVFPWDYGAQLREEIARRGAARIVECGLSNIFRVGGVHDGLYPLARLVRLVSNELPGDVRPKGVNIPINQMEILEHDRFLEFVP